MYEQSKLRSNIKSLSPLRDINQEFILRIPHFLSRLVDFATKLPCKFHLLSALSEEAMVRCVRGICGAKNDDVHDRIE